MKATATAHPIQGLIKYHGLVDPVLRLPFHDSISVCTAPLLTRTTVEFGDFEADSLTVDGTSFTARGLERGISVLEAVRDRAHIEDHARVVSTNSFPAGVGLGSSASGFAALAVAAAQATGLDLNPQQLSVLARRGAGSATRAVTGAFSKWRTGSTDEESYSEQLASEDLQMGILVALVPAYRDTEAAHREVVNSPFFTARLAEVPRMLAEMELAIGNGEVGRIAELAEKDTLLLHGITMTGPQEMVLWTPETLSVIMAVRRMREEEVPAFFSIDTGATVYVNTFPEDVDEVEGRVRELGIETLRCQVGGAAQVVDDHLF
ncbi:MAG: diphosphomevalonate decarboxylase [Thermoplasmata archaeon]